MEELLNRMILGTIAGILVGIWPLVRGVNSHQVALGVAGFFASVISGAVLGLILALPIAWLFSYLIKKNINNAKAGAEFNAEKT